MYNFILANPGDGNGNLPCANVTLNTFIICVLLPHILGL